MVKNNRINRRIIKSLDENWKKETPERNLIAALLETAHLGGYSEGLSKSYDSTALNVPLLYAIGMFVGYIYGLSEEPVGLFFNFIGFTLVFLGLQYFFRRSNKEWE